MRSQTDLNIYHINDVAGANAAILFTEAQSHPDVSGNVHSTCRACLQGRHYLCAKDTRNFKDALGITHKIICDCKHGK